MQFLASHNRIYLIRAALILSIVTIIVSMAEAGFSTWYGIEDEAISLLGFGLDSFVEIISGIGILHMVLRMQNSAVEKHDSFERTALYITGTAFYLLTAGLIVGVVINLIQGNKPQTTLPGIIISLASMGVMQTLVKLKKETGHSLNSGAILSDAACSQTCVYLSFILLGSSLVYWLFKLPFVDEIGSLGIAWFAFREGREAFQKAKTANVSCTDCCH